MKRIEYLANTIGPRPSATPKEKEGQDYVLRVLTELGCSPRVETFKSATSPFSPFLVGFGLVLLAELNYWFTADTSLAAVSALVAAVIAATVLISAHLEGWFTSNPMRWLLPADWSQNVFGVTGAGGEVRNRIVVMAHVDTQRTGLIWRTPRHFKVYRLLSALGGLSMMALTALFTAGVFLPGGGPRTVTLVPAALVGLCFVMVLEAHHAPFTPGANDNASGVGVMLALAEQLQREPLRHSEVWWVATGCEEVGACGSVDFLRRHRADLRDGTVIAVDSVGGRDTSPVYLTSEGLLLLLRLRYPAAMVELAEKVSLDNPGLGARPAALMGAYTDAGPALKSGMKCLALCGMTRQNWLPEWHRPTDTFANMDADALERAERFLLALLRKLDATAEST